MLRCGCAVLTEQAAGVVQDRVQVAVSSLYPQLSIHAISSWIRIQPTFVVYCKSKKFCQFL